VRDGNGKPTATLLAERGLAVYCPTAAFAEGTPKRNFGFVRYAPDFLAYNCIKFYKILIPIRLKNCNLAIINTLNAFTIDMDKIKILWVDDEIDYLNPHIIFLRKKIIVLQPAIMVVMLWTLENENFDVVFLDENMPGMSGLETLQEMKEKSAIPMIMITKSEEEYIMEEAIGSKIADYLIKPVNPNQILLSLKKT
jgi:CheY-like chemotaxis protein